MRITSKHTVLKYRRRRVILGRPSKTQRYIKFGVTLRHSEDNDYSVGNNVHKDNR